MKRNNTTTSQSACKRVRIDLMEGEPLWALLRKDGFTPDALVKKHFEAAVRPQMPFTFLLSRTDAGVSTIVAYQEGLYVLRTPACYLLTTFEEFVFAMLNEKTPMLMTREELLEALGIIPDPLAEMEDTYYTELTTYPDGSKKAIITYRVPISGERVRDGPFETFFPSGKRESVGNYTNGQPDGLYTTYYPDNHVCSHQVYAN